MNAEWRGLTLMLKHLLDGFLKRRGFSLIELSVVLVIASLMLGFGLQATQSSSTVDCMAVTRTQITTIHNAIDSYVRSKNVYPMPAGRALGVTDPMFGRAAPSATSGSIDRLANGTNPILFGALPFQTLGLPARFAADCWGNKFTYNVSQNLTVDQPTFATNAGAIIVNTGTLASPTPVITAAAYVVLSHGADGVGSAKKNASAKGWLGAATAGAKIDAENADGNTNRIIFAAAFNNGKSAGANYFDDLVTYAEKGQTLASSCLAQTLTWGTNCSAAVVQMADTQTAVVTNTAVGYGGTATANCNNGILTATVPVCGTLVTGVCGGWGRYCDTGPFASYEASCASGGGYIELGGTFFGNLQSPANSCAGGTEAQYRVRCCTP